MRMNFRLSSLVDNVALSFLYVRIQANGIEIPYQQQDNTCDRAQAFSLSHTNRLNISLSHAHPFSLSLSIPQHTHTHITIATRESMQADRFPSIQERVCAAFYHISFSIERPTTEEL